MTKPPLQQRLPLIGQLLGREAMQLPIRCSHREQRQRNGAPRQAGLQQHAARRTSDALHHQLVRGTVHGPGIATAELLLSWAAQH